jgi:hypothetical protein
MRMFAIVVFLCSGVVSADSQQAQSDADLRQKLVGTWTHETERTNTDHWFKRTEIYRPNGSFYWEVQSLFYGNTKLKTAAGFWQINRGIMKLTVTNSTILGSNMMVLVRQGTNYNPRVLLGYTNFSFLEPGTMETNYHKLIRIDKHELVYHFISKPMSVTNISDVITNRRLE